jgi:pyridoxal 5'-phosphate synthase pdxS subunit
MLRTKGEAGTGNVVEAVRHMRQIMNQIREVQNMPDDQLMAYAREIGAPFTLVKEVKAQGRLPVANFAAGGIATPADAALMMQLGADGIFVGSGIFKASDPAKRARAIVEATRHYNNPQVLAEVSRGLGEAMPGLDVHTLQEKEQMQVRGV